MEEVLISFLLYLNGKGLINNHDFDYEKQARMFLKKEGKNHAEILKFFIENSTAIQRTIINCKPIDGIKLKALNKAITKQRKSNPDNIL